MLKNIKGKCTYSLVHDKKKKTFTSYQKTFYVGRFLHLPTVDVISTNIIILYSYNYYIIFTTNIIVRVNIHNIIIPYLLVCCGYKRRHIIMFDIVL